MFCAWAGLVMRLSAMRNARREKVDTMAYMAQGERHTTRRRRKAAFLVGAASLFDLRGQRTYESMRRLMPDAPVMSVHRTYQVAARSLTPPSSRN